MGKLPTERDEQTWLAFECMKALELREPTCLEMGHAFGVIPHKSWGTLPKHGQKRWIRFNCDAAMETEKFNKKENGGSEDLIPGRDPSITTASRK